MNNKELEHLIKSHIKETKRIHKLNKKKTQEFQKTFSEQEELIKRESEKYGYYS